MEILLEIGVEEIPARFLVPALNNIEEIIKKTLKEQRINYEKIVTYGTPRRLVLSVNKLSEKQEDITSQNIGPAKNIAYDINGQLTKAGIGFAKSQGVEVTELDILKNEKGEYISVTKYEKGKNTEDLLPEILKKTILDINFPKTMRWGEKQFKFARPLRWILAICDNKLIPIEVAGIKSSMMTSGHRFFGEKEIEVKNIDDYFIKIKKNNVIIDIEKRKKAILDDIKMKTAKIGEKVLIEDELLDEVANLIEYPYPITGTFNAEFLEVPQEVLIITMQAHQRYFPILDNDGKLLPKFVLIRNGIEDSQEVQIGNEKVLSARLADARFFYYEDLKKNVKYFNENLKNVVFQNKLGTIYDKIERNLKIANFISDKLNIKKEEKIDILRTVEICKFDLVTNMIGEKEYTKLQGFMGMEYAKKFGEKDNVANGIYEHYMPRYQGDTLPVTKEGIIAAIVDKLDTIVGCFTVGLIPRGSQDPYALRRAALGIVNIILESKLEISIFDLVKYSLDIYESNGILTINKKDVFDNINEFFKDRIINVLINKGYKKYIIEAVVAADCDSIIDVEKKVEILEKVIDSDEFTNLIMLVKRVKNITKDFSDNDVVIDENFFVEKEEKNLYEYYNEFKDQAKKDIEKKDYRGFFDDLLKGENIINDFFEKVMVMDKNPNIKINRLSLLKKLDEIFNKIVLITNL
ncbi:MAG: glycine--tRNA ligase subunit beta [Fusobacteria bacterium]|nr:glycine--tRNA ligase subunit beta [Fusobacteriota bacterium]